MYIVIFFKGTLARQLYGISPDDQGLQRQVWPITYHICPGLDDSRYDLDHTFWITVVSQCFLQLLPRPLSGDLIPDLFLEHSWTQHCWPAPRVDPIKSPLSTGVDLLPRLITNLLRMGFQWSIWEVLGKFWKLREDLMLGQFFFKQHKFFFPKFLAARKSKIGTSIVLRQEFLHYRKPPCLAHMAFNRMDEAHP